MDIWGLQAEETDEGIIWYAWVDGKFVIDGYGYDNVKSAFDAIGEYTFKECGFRFTHDEFGDIDRIEPKKEKHKWKFW